MVEDEPDLSTLLTRTLQRSLGAEVAVAASGDVALRLIAEHTPDLVVLDLHVPVVDGMELCRLLRATASTADVSILMLTARSTEDDRVAGLKAGADDYVTKPFSLAELTARVRALLRRSASLGARDPRARSSTAADILRRTSTPSRSASMLHRSTLRDASLSCFAIWWRTATVWCLAIVCLSACGTTTPPWKRGLWTSTSLDYDGSWARPARRLKP